MFAFPGFIIEGIMIPYIQADQKSEKLQKATPYQGISDILCKKISRNTWLTNIYMTG